MIYHQESSLLFFFKRRSLSLTSRVNIAWLLRDRHCPCDTSINMISLIFNTVTVVSAVEVGVQQLLLFFFFIKIHIKT